MSKNYNNCNMGAQYQCNYSYICVFGM